MTVAGIERLEASRLNLQDKLDAEKTQLERNRLGQFATPSTLSLDILTYAKSFLGDEEDVRFLDPAIGTGSFYSALLKAFPSTAIRKAVGYEIDPHYGLPARDLWKDHPLQLRIADFTKAAPPSESDKFNLLVCNPPYVRHHHIQSSHKTQLKKAAGDATGVEISGLAGLYCYFLAISHNWLRQDGVAAWLIPSEFMDVNYGAAIKRYLLSDVTLLHVHRFAPSDLQFGDALVSSSIILFRKAKPKADHSVRFSFGGSLLVPENERDVSADSLWQEKKWTRHPMNSVSCDLNEPILSDYFHIKRGLATGDNKFFILSAEEIDRRGLPRDAFQPILPSPRYLQEDEVLVDKTGNPKLEHRLFLLNCRWEEERIKMDSPSLWKYLEEGKSKGVHERYICSHRSPWYSQENRPPVRILCTYLGRGDKRNGRPFRFIFNASKATAANVYLMLYPRENMLCAMREDPTLGRQVWRLLNDLRPSALLNEGRVYGGGLHKLEPKELGNVPIGKISALLPSSLVVRRYRQARLLDMDSQ